MLNPGYLALHSGCLWPDPTQSHLDVVPEVELSVKITDELKQAAASTPLHRYLRGATGNLKQIKLHFYCNATLFFFFFFGLREKRQSSTGNQCLKLFKSFRTPPVFQTSRQRRWWWWCYACSRHIWLCDVAVCRYAFGFLQSSSLWFRDLWCSECFTALFSCTQ